ncbi:hypothetical protein [Nocardioides sp. CFH 31398]|uniref:hypothetical protein n=1 Tax=Nocardioides sp. CFH 31398 TaxID=2919579 RepID=UPI001F06A2A1|nr:hypothetical protein [Nocardioides sp. CFH 31398]MCH1867769.1 hypothetical protein [Nocardioides sp. CFH 31398]
MSESRPARPARVRVTGPPRHVRPGTPRPPLDDSSTLGGVYLGSLLREQGRLALRVLGLLLALVGSLPLVFHLLPGLADVQVHGLGLPWLLLGVGVYPLLVVLGWRYVRRAERNERDFADLLDERRG